MAGPFIMASYLSIPTAHSTPHLPHVFLNGYPFLEWGDSGSNGGTIKVLINYHREASKLVIKSM
jgi:hypothetical protein